MKRLGIFFFYEKNGDVDDFITYYLTDLVKNLSELVIVCNGKLSEQGRTAFAPFTDHIIVRENKGLDVWAYKTALDAYGWDRLAEFDEIVMTNSTLMGPNVSFDPVTYKVMFGSASTVNSANSPRKYFSRATTAIIAALSVHAFCGGTVTRMPWRPSFSIII